MLKMSVNQNLCSEAPQHWLNPGMRVDPDLKDMLSVGHVEGS